MCDKKVFRQPNSVQVFLPFIFMIVMIILGKIVLNIETTLLLSISAAFTAGMAFFLGRTWNEVFGKMREKVDNSMNAIILLLLVGSMIGAMMASGTIPMLIYYGVQIISPKWLFVSGFLLCCIVSLVTGSSWGTLSTIGVTVFGIGAALNVNLAPLVACIIGGCWFGDKVSPLSGTNNLSAASAGVDIMEQFKYSLWSNIPAALIAIVFFCIVGFQADISGNVSLDSISYLMSQLDGIYNWNILLLLPILAVFLGSYFELPSIIIMFGTAAIAAVLGIIFQHVGVEDLGKILFDGFKVSYIPAAQNMEVGKEMITLLNRGGMMSMTATVLLMMAAMLYAGALESSGALDGLLTRITSVIKSAKSLMLASIFTCLGLAILTNNIVSSVVVGEMYRDLYKRYNLNGVNLSRILQDCGSGIIALVPWTASGAFVIATLGLNTSEFFMWSVFNWSGPIIVIILSITGIGIIKNKQDDINKKGA